MCGIAGFVGRVANTDEAKATLVRMCDAIRHRGPDDAGYHVAPGVALGMRRLSIIDVAGGHQPIANEDATIHVVFNGEIYNYQSLHDRLRRNGHRLATRSDTEALVHLYEEDGPRLVDALRGMFAFAIWDDRAQSLLVARDRLGIKPLYYWPTDDGVAFASELRALVGLPGFPRDLDPVAVGQYVAFGYVPDPRSIFPGVHKLPPGHRLLWDRERGVRVERYWTPARAENTSIDPQEAVAETRRLLEESVSIHLVSEVPLGAFLSGGIDSSGVVATMARLLDQPVQTFSIGFREREFDESAHAAAVARTIGTRHTELIVRPDADLLFEEIVRALDEPFADTSALPTFLVSHLARKDVTVALSGDGGDELFGGYTRYAELDGTAELSPATRAMLSRVGLALPHVAYGRNRLLDLGRTMRGRYASTVAFPVRESEGGVLRHEIAHRVAAHDRLLDEWFAHGAGRDFMTQVMIVDLLSYLPGDILTKVDRMSMAVSLEARVPLLDHHVVEFAMSLPAAFKLRGGVGKWVLREAITDRVPGEVFQRPKQGFDVPLRHWFRRELAYRLDQLLDPKAALYQYASPDAVSRIVREHRVGRRDHARMIWRLLVLERWMGFHASGELSHGFRVSRDVDALVDRAAAEGALATS